MKKIIFTVLLVIAFVPVLFAQRGQSTLRISLSDNSHLSVALNNRYFDKHGTSLTVGDLPAGRHLLKVYTYEVDEQGKGQAHLVYSGYIRLHRGTHAECIVDPNTGEIQLNENGEDEDGQYSYSQRQRMDSNGQGDRQYSDNAPVTDDVYDNGHDDRQDQAANTDNAPDKSSESVIGAFGTGAMSKGDMDGLKSMVRGKDGDAAKVQEMETQTTGKSFTIAQISKMMSWLEGDDSKLQLAEWAYPYVTDKENYAKLGSLFAKADYLKQLDDFIQSRK